MNELCLDSVIYNNIYFKGGKFIINDLEKEFLFDRFLILDQMTLNNKRYFYFQFGMLIEYE